MSGNAERKLRRYKKLWGKFFWMGKEVDVAQSEKKALNTAKDNGNPD